MKVTTYSSVQNWSSDWSLNLMIYKYNHLKPFEDAVLFSLFFLYCCFRFLGISCHYFHSFNFEFCLYINHLALINAACSSMFLIYSFSMASTDFHEVSAWVSLHILCPKLSCTIVWFILSIKLLLLYELHINAEYASQIDWKYRYCNNRNMSLFRIFWKLQLMDHFVSEWEILCNNMYM
jgi:hypothetical protein